MLAMDAIGEAIVNDPEKNVVTWVDSALAILNPLEYSSAPRRVFFYSIFIGGLAIRRFVLGQTFRSYILIVIQYRLVQILVAFHWFQHSRVTHKKLQGLSQLFKNSWVSLMNKKNSQ